MRVLVVEDADEKANDLAQFVRANYAVDEVLMARSFQSGLRAALVEGADLILLDMTMRNFDRTLEEEGGRPHHFAGREILRQMQREEVHIPVIVVTHFQRFGEESEEVTLSELKAELESRFPDYLGTVHYRSNVDEWKAQLQALIADRLSGGE
jgi:DNA-binding response OmpR family regulator